LNSHLNLNIKLRLVKKKLVTEKEHDYVIHMMMKVVDKR